MSCPILDKMSKEQAKTCPACNLPAIPGRKPMLMAEEEHAIKLKLKETQKKLDEVLGRKHVNAEYESFVSEAAARAQGQKSPVWTFAPSSKPRPSIMLSALSDLHFEEVVDPAVMQWTNAYNMQIARGRLKNYFNNLVKLAFDNLKGFNFEGLVMPWLGDFIGGVIHLELEKSNEVGPMTSVVELVPCLVAGVKLLADHFKKIHIPAIVGNHGRLDLKMPFKHPVQKNFDWLVYECVAREFKDDKRVTFDIPLSIDTFFSVYSYRFAAEHGNRLKGGTNAISGIYPSVSLGNYRKKNFQQSVGNPYDFLIIGDKHQLRFLDTVFINGSLVGASEFSRDLKLGWERPQQLFAVIDPDHGPTLRGPIFVQGKDEEWLKQKPKQ